MPKLSIDDLELQGKYVLVRTDFNVPIKDGVVADDFKIQSAIPTIKKIIDSGGRAILMSHLGRPKGKVVPELSLRPVADRLAKLIGRPVVFAPDCVNAGQEVFRLKNGGILLLENLRFCSGETAKGKSGEVDRLDIAARLSEYADLFVCDAFGTAHRDAASITGVAKVMGRAACGYLMQKELDFFTRAMDNPDHPVVVILGGKKASDKIGVIRNLMNFADTILMGGAMAYPFLKARGFTIGKSYCEGEIEIGEGKKIQMIDLAKQLLKVANQVDVEIITPIDHVISTDIIRDEDLLITPDAYIPGGYRGLDIGSATVNLFAERIAEARTVIWNGPVGIFEDVAFASGTRGISRAVASNSGLTVVCGGETAEAVRKFGVFDRMSHVSTGGGAALEFLEGKVLPGVAVLTDK